MYVSDKQFIVFFYRRLCVNNTGYYTNDFPFVSLCGRERNFVRCDDLPIVFTHIIEKTNTVTHTKEDRLSYGHVGELLTVNSSENLIFMNHCLFLRT